MKRLFTVVLMSVLALCLSACGSLSKKVTQTSDTIEAGSFFNVYSVFECKDEISIQLKDGVWLDTKKLGEVTVPFIITNGKKEEEKEYTFTVVDTTAPKIATESVSVYKNTEYIPEDHVHCTDNSGEEITATVKTNDVDLAAPGTYSVVYEAVDSSGNVAEKTASVEVVSVLTDDDIINVANDYLAENGLTEIFHCEKSTYMSGTLKFVDVLGLGFNWQTIDKNSTLKIHPEISVNCNKHGATWIDYYDVSYLMRMTIHCYYDVENGYSYAHYEVVPGSIVIRSDNTDETKIFEGFNSVPDFVSRVYFDSKFGFSIEAEDIQLLKQIADMGDVTIDFEIRPIIKYDNRLQKVYGSATPISYKFSENDLEEFKHTLDIYEYMYNVLKAPEE